MNSQYISFAALCFVEGKKVSIISVEPIEIQVDGEGIFVPDVDKFSAVLEIVTVYFTAFAETRKKKIDELRNEAISKLGEGLASLFNYDLGVSDIKPVSFSFSGEWLVGKINNLELRKKVLEIIG